MPSWLSSPFECAVLDIDSSVYPYYSIIVYIVIVQTHTIISLRVFVLKQDSFAQEEQQTLGRRAR